MNGHKVRMVGSGSRMEAVRTERYAVCMCETEVHTLGSFRDGEDVENNEGGWGGKVFQRRQDSGTNCNLSISLVYNVFLLHKPDL